MGAVVMAVLSAMNATSASADQENPPLRIRVVRGAAIEPDSLTNLRY
jgi:hypothetical protein